MYIIPFSHISIKDVAEVGGKNASLGEMFNQLSSQGIRVPDGFAISASAYKYFLTTNKLEAPLKRILDSLDKKALSNLSEVGRSCRDLISRATMPHDLADAISNAYGQMSKDERGQCPVAVRSSATAEDLPTASFAGQHESYLNINSAEDVVKACQQCYVSLFYDRAIKYRLDHGFDQMQVFLSAGVQQMVRADIGASGVAFTLEPESGFRNTIYITGIWGLGENIVQGAVEPDEFLVFKPTLAQGFDAILKKKIGKKEKTMLLSQTMIDGRFTLNIETTLDKQAQLTLSDAEVDQLARWCALIETHYGQPMDIEWAKDGVDNKIYIVQARPETVHSQKKRGYARSYHLKSTAKALCRGIPVGKGIVSGRARIINTLKDASRLGQGDIIIADVTNPDWNALLKKAVCIVTNKGGRTSHASIIARELGIPALVGTANATDVIKDGDLITVSCLDAEGGSVYPGRLEWEEHEIDFTAIPSTHTKPMLILAHPDRAFELSFYPNDGVGLLRMEFIISNSILVHPMALVRFDELPEGPDKMKIAELTRAHDDKEEYFIEKLARSVSQVAAAFYPKDVIVRMSDFKTNEYAALLGGTYFEPAEENPMLGFRGASRYYHPRYQDGFRLECEAMKRVREQMGLTNVKLMIPFCRTVEEGRKVVQLMDVFGLKRGYNGLEIYVMCEVPSNVILAEEFARIFDGFSIGSNDLTQLTLGIDRDSTIINGLFDERNVAVTWMLSTAISKAKKAKVKIGLCGQAPSDYPEFARFLVEQNIDSISFNADALIKGIENIHIAEQNISPDNI